MPWDYIGALFVIACTVVLLLGVYGWHRGLRDSDEYKCPAEGDGDRDEK